MASNSRTDVMMPEHKIFIPKEDKRDMVAWLYARETRAREQAIAVEITKILRERVQECQRANPINHYYKCADLVAKYRVYIDDPFLGVREPKPSEPQE